MCKFAGICEYVKGIGLCNKNFRQTVNDQQPNDQDQNMVDHENAGADGT